MGLPLPHAVLASIANTNRDGQGTIQHVFTAGPSGAQMDSVRFKATGTTTAGMIRMYVAAGKTWALFEEVLVTALTPSGTVKSFCYVFEDERGPTTFAPGERFGVSSHNAETFTVSPEGRQLP